jgi:hypothetical protein
LTTKWHIAQSAAQVFTVATIALNTLAMVSLQAISAAIRRAAGSGSMRSGSPALARTSRGGTLRPTSLSD